MTGKDIKLHMEIPKLLTKDCLLESLEEGGMFYVTLNEETKLYTFTFLIILYIILFEFIR
jgi:hypothetical protein